MSNVTDIWLFVQTSTVPNAFSKASLQLNVNGTNVKLPTASQQTSSNTLNLSGASAQFHWSQNSSNWPAGAITTNNLTGFTLQIVGANADDMWIPASIWVVFLTDVGEYVLGPQYPTWNSSDCFSTQSSDCENANSQWPLLNWSQSAPIVEFTSGGLTEQHLEPSETATYQFYIMNLSKAMTINNMVIAIKYDQELYNGVTIDVGVGPSGYPEIIVQGPLPPGGSIPQTFDITTSNATPQTYEFNLLLLSWEVSTATSEITELYVDKAHQFTVVPD